MAHEAPEREGSVALRLVDLNPSRRKQIRSGATMLFAPWDVVVEEHHVLDLRTERLRIDIRAARGSSEQGSSFDASRVWKLPLTPGMSHEEFRTSVVSWQPSRVIVTFDIEDGFEANQDPEAIEAACGALLDAKAVPSFNGALIVVPGAPDQQRLSETLEYLSAGGIVERTSQSGQAHMWKITKVGMLKLAGNCEVEKPRSILTYRSDVPLMDLSTYELVDFLWSRGVQPFALEQGKGMTARIKALVPFQYGVRQSWHVGSRAMNVNRMYMLALAMEMSRNETEDAEDRAEPLQICHFKKESYYVNVIKCIDKNVAFLMLKDSAADDHGMFALEGGLQMGQEEGTHQGVERKAAVKPMSTHHETLQAIFGAEPAEDPDGASDIVVSGDEFEPPPKKTRKSRKVRAAVQVGPPEVHSSDGENTSDGPMPSTPGSLVSSLHPSDIERLASSSEEDCALTEAVPHASRQPRTVTEPQKHGVQWGPFWLARVYSGGKASGTSIGWSCVCGRHHNVKDERICKKQLPLGGKRMAELSDAEALHRIKVWLVVGMNLPSGSQQRDHIRIQPRDLNLDDYPEADLDSVVLALPSSSSGSGARRSKKKTFIHSYIHTFIHTYIHT